ncbi:exonuclease I [Plasmodium gonderi]|uniref:Exonuclease 1 n=1 Tax=Plasmodium gonderi TaxID=77519 RepID=A0A1Y1JA56_PLAGO|nr:exonuclease I [Plasmodium gonderi]GAW79389.1 exonuclease I [Plasmodium gonderi]
MGISNLLQFLKPIVKNSHISKYKNEVIGVDIMCWIHRGLISCAYDIVTENFNDSYLSFIEKMLECIYHYNIKVIFVFDGEELPEKKTENMIRKDRREKAKKEAHEIIKKVKNPRSNETVLKKCIQALSVSKDIINTVINFCKQKNIDYIISPYEADAQLSYLCRMGYISCVISEDSDLLVYGCPRVLYKFKNNGECNEISLLPINDLIDINVINKIRNPFSDSFNKFYITPMKEEPHDTESECSDADKQDLSSVTNSNTSRTNRYKNHRRDTNKNSKRKKEKKKKNYEKTMKEYLDQFYWPEELDKLKHFNIDMFLAMCILSGCDYTNDFHITGMGIKTAFSLIYQYKNIEQIFSFLISHDKWKHKIPPNLNTLEKLLNKYEEIKNAFLHHQVYDFILCQNISINQSFNSALKEKDNQMLINKISDYSLIYNNSTRKGNCLNRHNEGDSISDTMDEYSISSANRSTERSISNAENANQKQQENNALMEKNADQNVPREILSFRSNENEIQKNTHLHKPNNFENIFKNFSYECLEYLEISPILFKNYQENQSHHQKTYQEKEDQSPPIYSMRSDQMDSHRQIGCHDRHQPTLQEYAQDHYEKIMSKKENRCEEMLIRLPPDQSDHMQIPNFQPNIEITKLDFFQDSTLRNEYACKNMNSSDINTSGKNEKAKLNKRKANVTDSFNFKKAKTSTIIPVNSNGKTCTKFLDEIEINDPNNIIQNSHNMIQENKKLLPELENVHSGEIRSLKEDILCENITKINDSENKWNPGSDRSNEYDIGDVGIHVIDRISHGDLTNSSGKVNKMKSARDMYDNMKKKFLLFKTLSDETDNQTQFLNKESKYEPTASEDEYAHIRKIQETCMIKKCKDDIGSSLETEICDQKQNIQNGVHINANSYAHSNVKDEICSEMCNKSPSEKKNNHSHFDNNSMREKNEINNIHTEPERKNNPSSFSSPSKSKISVGNEKNKTQLRITNFFKSEGKKRTNSKSNDSNINTFSVINTKNIYSNDNKKYSVLLNKSEPLSEDEQMINALCELDTNQVSTNEKVVKYEKDAFGMSNTQQYKTLGLDQDIHDEYIFLKNLQNCGLIKESIKKEPLNCTIKTSDSSQNFTGKRGHRINYNSGDQETIQDAHQGANQDEYPDEYPDEVLDGDQHNCNSPPLRDNLHSNHVKEKKEKQKEINLEYILQNLNYNYQPKNHKINTLDYFKEKENVTPHNPYVDNNL